MSTQSYIGIENIDGVIDYVSCAYDSYVQHNGLLLEKFYNTQEKVKELISFGSICVLDEKIHPNKAFPHNYVVKQNNVTIFYHRDYATKNDEMGFPLNISHALSKDDIDGAYIYIFTLNNEWIYKTYTNNEFKTIKSYMEENKDDVELFKENIAKSHLEVGDEVQIDYLYDETQNLKYRRKTGIVEYIDSIGQAHGTWGGLAIIPEIDSFTILRKYYEIQKSDGDSNGK